MSTKLRIRHTLSIKLIKGFFSKPTPSNMTTNNELQNIIDEGNRLNHKIEIVSNVKSGKEATIYKVMLDHQLVAMKVYKKPEERSFKNTGQYLMGKYYKKPSHRKAIEKGNKFAKKIRDIS